MPPVQEQPAQTNLAEQLLSEVEALLAEMQPGQRPRVGLDSRIDSELGLDSLARVELVVRVEHRFDVRLPAEAFAEIETPHDLLQAVSAARASSPRSADVESVPAAPKVADAGVPRVAATLPEVLRWHAEQAPERTHIHLLRDGREVAAISYRQLLQDAERAAVGLQLRGVVGGDRVALMLPTGTDYFVSFFGILLCGAVPVPIYPPARSSQLAEHLGRHGGILHNSGAVLLVTVPEARPLARLLQARAEGLRAVVSTADLDGDTAAFIHPPLAGDDIAFLQYTSGSTGSPKGVILSHADLLASIRAMGEAIEAGPDDVFVSWLPLYHDMGLIGAWLGSLYYGLPLVIMSPLDFIARPLQWLEAIHRYRGTLSASPNFGYELCLKRVSDEQLAALDLRHWRAAFNGAEPVSPLTLERFAARFAATGFQRAALMPVYGLAEAALGLAFPPPGRGPRIDRVERRVLAEFGEARPVTGPGVPAVEFASCGRALAGYRLRVVDDRGGLRPERYQGRIQFQGPSATRGYFNNPEASRKLFDGDWLETGDLGYLADGELYLTSRVKDLIVHAGRNLYPQELEESVGDIPGIRKGCVAVFGSIDPGSGTERLVVLAETRFNDEERRSRLREAVLRVATDVIGTPPEVVRFVPPHGVLKTSSGKIRRSANREAYEQGRLEHPASGPGLPRLVLDGLPGMLRGQWRRLREHGFALWAWSVFWVLAPLTWLAVAVLPRRAWRFSVSRLMARALAGLTGTGVDVSGTQQLPVVGRGCVLVANHASYLDGPLLIAAVPRELAFVAKEALSTQFIAGTYLRRMGAEFVERFDPRRGLDDLRRIRRLADADRALVFFAEGTFGPSPGLRPFRMGAFVTAMEAQLPVVPVAIAGTRGMLRSGSWYPHRGRLKVTIGEAIMPPPKTGEPGKNWREALVLRHRVRQHILDHCGEPDLAGDR